MTIYHSLEEKAMGLKLKKIFPSAQTMDAPPSLLYFWPLHFGNQGAGPELQQLLNTILSFVELLRVDHVFIPVRLCSIFYISTQGSF